MSRDSIISLTNLQVNFPFYLHFRLDYNNYEVYLRLSREKLYVKVKFYNEEFDKWLVIPNIWGMIYELIIFVKITKVDE